MKTLIITIAIILSGYISKSQPNKVKKIEIPHITKINDSLYVAHFKNANVLYLSKNNNIKVLSYESPIGDKIEKSCIDDLEQFLKLK